MNWCIQLTCRDGDDGGTRATPKTAVKCVLGLKEVFSELSMIVFRVGR